ncbi:MAG: hypothetical protein Q8N53_03965 [Longimicrobiales bacterium]|nr:hypothetical protein [Longimicrobiales bacterium]
MAPVVPAGTSLTFVVNEEVSTSDHQVGHTFTSTLAGDGMGVDGATAAPAGSIGRWVVTEATNDIAQGKSVLGMKLEAVSVNGTWYPVVATVTEAELPTDQKDSNTETAAKIGRRAHDPGRFGHAQAGRADHRVAGRASDAVSQLTSGRPSPGRTRSQASAATTERAAAMWSAYSHPIMVARIGVSAGDTSPPTLLPMFMIPPAVPLRVPDTDISVLYVRWDSVRRSERVGWRRTLQTSE